MTLFSRHRLLFDHGWTAANYTAVRAIFGVYLFVHFAHLTPWAAELYSREGVVADATTSPLAYAFPNLLTFFDAPWFATALVATAAGASLLLALGKKDRLMALLIWYIWACTFGRNPLTANPSLAFVGWMLLFHAALPSLPSLLAMIRRPNCVRWRMPRAYFTAAWIVMAAGYTYSGITKLVSPSWVDGTAIAYVLQSPLARVTPLRDLLLALPEQFLQTLTWATLGLELLALPLALIARARPWLWLSMVGLHLGIIATVAFADLSVGMLMIHLITFNPDWLRAVGEFLRPLRPHFCPATDET